MRVWRRLFTVQRMFSGSREYQRQRLLGRAQRKRCRERLGPSAMTIGRIMLGRPGKMIATRRLPAPSTSTTPRKTSALPIRSASRFRYHGGSSQVNARNSRCHASHQGFAENSRRPTRRRRARA